MGLGTMTTATATVSPIRSDSHPAIKRSWKIAAALIIVAAVAGIVFRARSRAAAKNAPAFRFETTTADRGPIRAKVTATGTVNPIVTVQVGAQVLGDHCGAGRGLQLRGQARTDDGPDRSASLQGRRPAGRGELPLGEGQRPPGPDRARQRPQTGEAKSEPLGPEVRGPAGRRHDRHDCRSSGGPTQGGRGGGRPVRSSPGDGEDQPGVHDDPSAGQRHRHHPQHRCRSDGGSRLRGSDAFPGGRRPDEDAGRHEHRRGRRRPARRPA